MEYLVSIEINGQPRIVGTISGATSDEAVFRYARGYLDSPYAAPISVSLPLKEQSYSPEATKNFFDGLLPEGFTRGSVASRLQLDENDYLRILYNLGRECIGALRIHTADEDSNAYYEKLGMERIKQLAAEGASESTALVVEARLSLTGASGKVGLYRSPAGEWYLPHGTAPSTHIVKQSHVRLQSIVPNELLCLDTAKRMGIDIPESSIINTGNGSDADVLLASKRFDRVFADEPYTTDELPIPLRLHQEDLAQAMGIPAKEKYEQGRHYLADMFTLIRNRSARPVEDQLKLWDITVFNYLIGNTDGHLKNFSLLYSPDLRSLRLAPAYDIINATGYGDLTKRMAFAIGGATQIDEVTRDSFRLAAKEVGLGERMAMRRLDDAIGRFKSALYEASDALSKEYPEVKDIRDKILAFGGIRFID